MTSQQLDEKAILEVAREIRSPAIRAKYLEQVCHDERLLGRLEGRLMAGRRWQFSLRTFLVVMLLFGCGVAGMGVVAQQGMRARQAETRARQQAIRAAELAKRAEMISAEAAASKLRRAEEADHE